MTDPKNTFWTDSQLEARWRRKPGYLAELRAKGIGPKFIRLSPRVVVHRGDHIEEYEETHTFASNAEAMAAANGDSPEGV